MKKVFKYAMLFMAAGVLSTGFTSCSDDDDDNSSEEQNTEIQTLTNQYLNNVVEPTYTSLANETETLYQDILALKVKLQAGTAVQQSEIDAICASYKAARKYWEQSEAFLYGAASDFKIDPHIDTWPLDVPSLAKDLGNDSKIASLNTAAQDGKARNYVSEENLGFHGLEFIFFRNGKNRQATFFNNDTREDDENFSGVNVTGKEEVIFAAAIACDLRDKCWQLEVAWLGNKAAANHRQRVTEMSKVYDDFNTVIEKNQMSYGSNLVAVGKGSTYASWKKVVEEILVGGCSNICAEVADQKMGQAYRTATSSSPTYHEGEDGEQEQDDPNYIESPYSHNSFNDFYDNIVSIQNSLYGNIEGSAWTNTSIMSYLHKHNAEKGHELDNKLKAALSALQACKNSGVSFVEAPGAAHVKTAMDAITELDDCLNATSAWILAN